MTSLLYKTIEAMKVRGDTFDDVVFIGSKDLQKSYTIKKFKKVADQNFKLFPDLVIVFKDNSYMYRESDEDSEWWVYGYSFGEIKQKPKRPLINKEVKHNLLDGKEIIDETISMAQINVGKIIYKNTKVLLHNFLPKQKWYDKLFSSKKKRDIAELITIYGLLHLVKVKYNHYLIDSLTMYINFELQNKLVDTISIIDLDNLFKLPTKV